MPDGPDELLTVWQVAKLLSIDEETVRRWLRSGRLDGIRISRKAGWRIRASDYYDFLDLASAANGGTYQLPRPWLTAQEQADDADDDDNEDEDVE